MTRALDALARVAIRIPSLTLSALLAITIGFGMLATQLDVDTGVEGFAPDEGLVATFDEINDRFASGSTIQVLLDAGPGGNVLDRDTIVAVSELRDDLHDDPAINAALRPEQTGRPPIVSFAYPFTAGFDDADERFDELAQPIAELVIDAVVTDAADDIAPLLSNDFDAQLQRARSGLMQVGFDGDVDAQLRRTATIRAGEIIATFEHNGIRTGVLSNVAIEQAIESSLNRDLPRLLSISMMLVLLVLALLFRSFADVVVGFAGLMAAIVWMFGFGVMLGPKYLGVIGDFNQIGIAIPVLLVGLGVDYSVHLTTRYREQRMRGDDPRQSARTAVTTVGFALVLATIASVAGFLSNIATPLPPIRDFGILAAIGIVAAFVILGAAVPAARVMIDRRRRASHPRAVAGAPASPATSAGGPDAASTNAPTPRDRWWVRLTVAVATRRAAPALTVTALLLGAGIYAATGLSTEFDDRDFLPEGEALTALIDRLDAQFGGDVGERTFVLIDGDTSDAQLLAQVAVFEDALSRLDRVRFIGDRPDVVSPYFFVEMTALQGERVRANLADDIAAWSDPDAAAQDVDLPNTIDDSMIDDGDELDLPEDLDAQLVRRLQPGRTPIAAVVATMDRPELERTVREALAQSYVDERPSYLSDDDVEALAQLDEIDLSLARLMEFGLAVDLTETQRASLATLERLEAAGWDGDRPANPLKWAQLIDVVREDHPEDLDSTLDDAGILLNIATAAGQDAADLSDEIAVLAEQVRGAGGEATVVSDQLLQAEIIDSLASAQLQAIIISLVSAGLLLVTAAWFTSRSVALGLIGIVPSTVALIFVLGTMRLAGIPFNALTATVASISVGIGVPYGIHLINRFREARAHGLTPDAAITDTLRNTGPALIGSAVTTGLAFGVLVMSASTPIAQFGQVSSFMIFYALFACLFVQPSLLVVWARRRDAVGAR